MSKSKSAASGFLWRFFERCGAQGVTFLVSIVLARLLDPEAYGTVALITVITSILQVFVDSGLGNALIQKKDADHLDFSSVFYFNMAVCLFLYGLMFFSAPLIAVFYNKPELVSLVRVMSLTLIISGVKNIQQAYVSKKMLFKKFFFATLGGTIAAAIVGIMMAYSGCGPWAIIVQSLVNATMDTVILWITVKWRPKLEFSFSRLKSLLSYGWKLLVSSLIDHFYNNVRQLVIGKMYSSESLAFYNKGKQFPNLFINNINASIDSVLLPVMAEEQDNVNRVKTMTRRSIMVSTYIITPLLLGLAVVAKPLVSIILTDKWLPCVPFLQIFCITFVFHPIHTSNLNAIKALGRSDILLKLDIIKRIVGFSAILITMWWGVMPMAYSMLVTSVINQIINSWPNKKLMNYSYKDQLIDIVPVLIVSIIMALVVYGISLFDLNNIVILCIQVPTGLAVYLGSSWLFKLEAFRYCLDVIKRFLGKDKKK